MTDQHTIPTGPDAPGHPDVGTLTVPGATLRYEVRGAGPLLLLIPGGSGDADVFDGVAPALADRFTVASYDPRGVGRSTVEGPAEDQRVEVHAADARRLLDLLSPDEPAYVLGCSSGAITALDLLARHPERLRRVIAHEPPLAETLPEPTAARALFTAVRDTAVREGTAQGMKLLGEGLTDPAATSVPAAAAADGPAGAAPLPPEDTAPAEGPGAEPVALPPHAGDKWARMQAGAPFFLRHILCPFTRHTPDLAELRTVPERLLLAVGEDSRGHLLDGLTRDLAATLGAGLVTFPGGHIGPTEHPARFAATLRAALLDEEDTLTDQ